jgi:uncharacterized lipoprotein YajG
LEETNKVKRRIYFVKRGVFQGPQISLINADKKNLPRMNAKMRESIVRVLSRDSRSAKIRGKLFC